MNVASEATFELAPGQFDRIAKALADPRRFAILESVASKSDCPYQGICCAFPITKATVSHHMKELYNAGLIDTVREGQTMVARFRPEVMAAYRSELVRRLG